MQAKLGEPKQEVKTSGTYGSVTINAYMFAAAANQALAATDYKPEQVQISVVLRRGGATHRIMSSNLLVLGIHAAKNRGLHWFLSGFDRIYAASGVKALKQRSITLPFKPVRCDKGDELVFEVNPSETVWGANIDTSLSYIDFYFNRAIGYEYGLSKVETSVVNANVTDQPFNLGNGVTKITVINTDKDNLSEPVISQIALSSDRFDESLTFTKLLARVAEMDIDGPAFRLGATPPTQSVFRFADTLPQTFCIFDGERCGMDSFLDDAQLDIQFNSANVNSSKNYVAWTQVTATKEQVEAAMNRQRKHQAENILKLPSEKK